MIQYLVNSTQDNNGLIQCLINHTTLLQCQSPGLQSLTSTVYDPLSRYRGIGPFRELGLLSPVFGLLQRIIL
jgi:hypothetical protein